MPEYLKYIPSKSRLYCLQLSFKYDFAFKLKNDRSSKLGDFKRDFKRQQFVISVNRGLNPYQFLITFIHELAHLKVAINYPRFVKAHGKEWKESFKELLAPVLEEDIFPQPLLDVLKIHMNNPKAAAGSDPKLWQALRAYNISNTKNTLNDLLDGTRFTFKTKHFTRVNKKRTRILCKEDKTGKFYLIQGIAEVEV